MGAAKRAGTFEQRRDAAIARRAAEQAVKPPESSLPNIPRKKSPIGALALIAMAASIGMR